MNLQTLLDDTSVPSLELTGLCEHSAEVRDGFGFCAVSRAAAQVAEHCREADRRGAAALLWDAGLGLQELKALQELQAPNVAVQDLVQQRGRLAARFYAEPSAALTCIGVTGTNGKTSTAYHLADLLELCGAPCGYIGTLGSGRLTDLVSAGMTTPNPVALQRLLAAARDAGAVAAALEVSSHALDQDRAAEVAFDAAVFTNISRDHLDYHGSMANYQRAKARLFTRQPLRAAVINVDDAFGRQLVSRSRGQVVTYGRGGDWQWQMQLRAHGAEVAWRTPHGNFTSHLQVVAEYAVANITAAAAAAVALGHPFSRVMAGLDKLRGVPGRMEVVSGTGQREPMVVVDYAHTPDALQKVLSALRHRGGQLICVVGCGGDRDAGKRPIMGQVAARLADTLWLTSDNPRSEDPAAIIRDMRGGTGSGKARVFECVDRGQAIAEAISAAAAGDTVVIAGKGHEDYQEIGGARLDFDDRRAAREVLRGVH